MKLVFVFFCWLSGNSLVSFTKEWFRYPNKFSLDSILWWILLICKNFKADVCFVWWKEHAWWIDIACFCIFLYLINSLKDQFNTLFFSQECHRDQYLLHLCVMYNMDVVQNLNVVHFENMLVFHCIIMALWLIQTAPCFSSSILLSLSGPSLQFTRS